MDGLAESVEGLNKELSQTGFETQFASTATNTLTNQTKQLDGQTKKVTKTLKKAAEQMEEVVDKQDANLMLVAHTADMIDQKGAPAMNRLEEAIKKVDREADQGQSQPIIWRPLSIICLSQWHCRRMNIPDTSEGFNFLLEETVGVEFFNRLDFIF